MSVRRDPFDAMERMFDQLRRGGFAEPLAGEHPTAGFDANVSLEREDDAFVAMADLPGFEREEIDLAYADGVLTINGTHEADEGDGHRARTVRETITVPENVDAEAIEASYKNGVLEVRLPFEDAETRGYRIDIE